IQRQRELAQQMLAAQSQAGQMVGDWYAPAPMAAHVGSLVQNLLGAYTQRKADSEANALAADKKTSAQQSIEQIEAMRSRGQPVENIVDDEYGPQTIKNGT